jgi:putative transposase
MEKSQMIEPGHSELSIKRQCELLSLSRATYYAGNKANADESDYNLTLMRLIDEEYTRHPFYGSRKMVIYLTKLGYPVNRKRVQRLILESAVKF